MIMIYTNILAGFIALSGITNNLEISVRGTENKSVATAMGSVFFEYMYNLHAKSFTLHCLDVEPKSLTVSPQRYVRH